MELRSRLRPLLRLFGRLAAALALALWFALAGALGLAIHADTPLGRRLAARVATRLLSSVFEGRIEVQGLAHLHGGHLATQRVVLQDRYGNTVLVLDNLRVDIPIASLLWDVLVARQRLTVIIPHIRVEHAETRIIPDPKTGEPTIVHAVTPRSSGAAAGVADEALRVRVWMPLIEVGRADGRIAVEDVPPFGASVAGVRGQMLVTPKGIAVDVQRFGAVLKGFWGHDARGTATFSARAPGALRGSFDGFFGDVELQARVKLEKNHLELDAQLPGAAPAAVNAILPGWPLKQRVSGRVQATGDLPRLDTNASLRVGDTSALEVRGPVHLTEPFRAELDLDGRDIDLAAIWPDAPKTAIASHARLVLAAKEGRLTVDIEGSTLPTEIGGEPVPAMDVKGTLSDAGFSGSAKVHEPGAPADVDFSVDDKGVIELDARVPSIALGRTPRLPPVAQGNASVRAHARIADNKITARMTTNVSGLSTNGVKLARGRVEATATGSLDSLDALNWKASVDGAGLSAGQLEFDTVKGTVSKKGDGAEFSVDLRSDTGPSLRATGQAAFRDGLSLSSTKVSMRHGEVVAEGVVTRLEPERGIVDIDDIQVAGAGGPITGWVRQRPGLFEAEVHGERVELEKLATAVGLPKGELTGTGRIDAEIAAGKDVTRGRVRLGLTDGGFGPVRGLSVQLSGELDGRRVTGDASGLLAHVGTFGGSWDGELDGPAFEARSWKRITGQAQLTVSDIKLPVINLLLPEDAPIQELQGKGFARFLIERREPDGFPNVMLTAMTQGLAMKVMRKDDPIKVSGMDLYTTGGINGETGDSTGTTLVTDAEGELVVGTGAMRVDLQRLVREPGTIAQQVMVTPIDIVLQFPRRPIASLPEFVRPEGIQGEVSGSLHIKGSLERPTLFAGGRATGLIPVDSPDSPPVDVTADGQFAPDTGELIARATATLEGRQVAIATARGQVLDLSSPDPWHGAARLEVHGLPFGLIGGLARNRIGGRLHGEAELVRRADEKRLHADLTIENATIERTVLGDGELRIESDGPSLEATLGLKGPSGRLNAHARARLLWRGLLPVFDDSRPVSGDVSTEDFDAVALSPLLTSVFRRMTGQIDARLRFQFEKKALAANRPAQWMTSIDGSATVENGVVLFEVLGLELRDIEGVVSARSDGKSTRISVREVRAKARSQDYNFFGSADVELEGVRVTNGTATLRTDELPLLLEGVLQGRATGQAKARLTRYPDYMLVEVDIPVLMTRLPRASGRDVIELDDHPDVLVLQHQAEEEETGDILPWQLVLNLGERVRLRRSDVDLAVRGTPIIELGQETQVYGKVQLASGGRIPIFGNVFIIDSGEVHFDTGDASNPRVDVTAEWRAAGGILVFADITGTLNDLKVRLRSDPPLPEPQVFALLLGGTPAEQTPRTGSQDESTAAGAVALGTGVAALGVNELLGDQPVELRVGTTEESRPRYTAAVRVGSNLWFEASTYQRSSGSVSGDERNVFSGTIDYRFTRRWSLRTEVGTAGGAVDLLWQFRY